MGFQWHGILIAGAVALACGFYLRRSQASKGKTLWRPAAKIVIALSAVYIAYKIEFPTYSCHVRLTVEVEQNGEKKTGSSVIELRAWYFPTFFGLIDWGTGFDSRGEAAFLDMGHGDNLIALLGLGGYARDDIWVIVWRRYFRKNLFPSSLDRTLESAFSALEAQVGKPEILSPSDMPTMARFRDINDPKSIEAVNPGDLAATYGPGVKFLRATLEITDDPVTWGVIEKRLPWLRKMIGDDPMDHLPISHAQVPELKQDRIFFVGFVRG